MAASSKHPVKGKKWLDEEVESLLRRLHHAGAGGRVMSSTHMETLSVFEGVVLGMRSEGYIRSGHQARSKFKREKSDFYEVMQRHHGHPPPGERPPRFNLLKRLWIQADRPHWAYRFPGSSSKSPRKRKVRLDEEEVLLLTSEEEEEEEEEGASAEGEVQAVGDSEEDMPSTSAASKSALKSAQGPVVVIEEEKTDSGHSAQSEVRDVENFQQRMSAMEDRFEKLESRVQNLEKATSAMLESNSLQRKNADQQEKLLQMHTKAILILKRMVGHDRTTLGVSAPSGEEEVLPDLDEDE